MAIARSKDPNSYVGRLTLLKKLFWLYFFLLIFEGALRKWVAPQLSGPLLIIRDPVGIWIIWEAYRTHKWPERWSSVTALLTVGVMSLFLVQSIAGVNPWFVGLFGLRTYLLPFPVLFIMGENLDEEDLDKLGKFTVWLLLPMTALEVAQYITPSNSFVNNGAYEGGGQISFVGAHVRASGTFSFVVGSVEFDVLAAAFVFYGMVKEGLAKNWVLWASAFALILSVPMTGSRGLVFQLAAVVGCVSLGAIMGISQFGRTLRIIVPVLIVSFLVSLLPIFSDATKGLSERFTGAYSGEEGSPLHTLYFRMVAPIVDKIETSDFESNAMGIGLGRSAIAVQAFLTGETVSVAGEDDFSRVIEEMGPITGLGYQLFRFLLAAVLFGKALAQARDHQPLALLLAPLSLNALLFASFEQTTEQGFMIVGVAMMIAAAKRPEYAVPPAITQPLFQRRPIYRPRLHRG